jgi:hypothetical protein
MHDSLNTANPQQLASTDVGCSDSLAGPAAKAVQLLLQCRHQQCNAADSAELDSNS